MIDLKFNYPSLTEEGVHLRDWMNSQPNLQALLTYPPVQGLDSTREAGRNWLNVDPKVTDVVVANSGNHALTCVTDFLEGKVTGIVTDPFTYPAFKHIAQKKKIILHPAPTDHEGLTLEGIEDVVRKTKANVLYLQPTIHNPTCTVMSLSRRKAIADFVAKNGLTILEDDAYRFLHPSAPPSFLDLLPDHTIHIESLSKPFNPLLKVTFIALPKAFSNDMANVIRLTSSGTSSLLMAFTEHIIHTNILDGLIRKKQAHAEELKREITSTLNGLSYQTHENSFHLWLTMPQKIKSIEVSNALGHEGILIPTGNDFETVETRAGDRHIRVALAAERNLQTLAGALVKLKTLVQD